MTRIASLREDDVQQAKSLGFRLFTMRSGSLRKTIHLNFNPGFNDISNILDDLKPAFKSDDFYKYIIWAVDLMSKFPKNWVETDFGRLFQVDTFGSINKRDYIFGWAVRNRGEYTYTIDPVYLRAIPFYLEQFGNTLSNYENALKSLKSYPVIGSDVHRVGGMEDGSELPNRLVYTMNLIEGKLRIQNPRKSDYSANNLTDIISRHPELLGPLEASA